MNFKNPEDYRSNVFGCCPVCGDCGADDSDPGAGFAPARDTTGSGVKLYLYRGDYLCKQCMQDLINSEKSQRMSGIDAARESWRMNIGFE